MLVCDVTGASPSWIGEDHEQDARATAGFETCRAGARPYRLLLLFRRSDFFLLRLIGAFLTARLLAA